MKMEDQQRILALRGPPVTSGANEATTTILFPCNAGGAKFACISVLLVWLVLEWLVLRTHDELRRNTYTYSRKIQNSNQNAIFLMIYHMQTG